MKKIECFLFIILITLTLHAATEYYLKIEPVHKEQLKKLTRLVSIDKIDNNTVFAYANQKELDFLRTTSFSFQIIPGPLAGFEPIMANTREQMRDWDNYPTYETYVELMYQFATDHPDICEVYSIGNSLERRELIVAHIGDDLATDDDEPEFYYMGQIHGDELVASIVLMHLIDDLLTQYGSDPRIDNIIENVDLYINPLTNPDGLYAGGNQTVSGATRANANGIDMNRNYPDPEDGMHPDGNDTQLENLLQIDFANQHNFVISANFHSGTEVVNYPWDTWSTLNADDDWWQLVSHTYADAAQELSPNSYFNEFDDGITNGFQWYTISGGYQDYCNWYHHTRSVTLELSDVKAVPENQLLDHYLWNYNSLLFLIEESLYGVRGTITSPSGDPIPAKIYIDGHDNNHSEVYASDVLGNYHRPIYEGIYDFTFSAWGYEPQTITIASPAHGTIIQDITLQPAALANLDGMITDAESGFPIFGAWVQLPETHLPAVMTNSLGEYFFYDIPAGEYDIFAYANRYASQITNINVLPGTNNFYFNLTPSPAISFEDGQFPTDFDFSFSGNADWFITDDNAYDGITSARSGAIGNNSTSSMLLTINLESEGSISFRKKVSSEENYDYLYFYIDNSLQGTWEGDNDWSYETYDLNAGNHILKWEYDKDNAVSGGADCAWIDVIEIEGLPEIESTRGDVDNNSFIEAFDASLVLRYAVDMNPGTAAPLPWQNWRYLSADVDENGMIQAYDASLILQLFLGIIEQFPEE